MSLPFEPLDGGTDELAYDFFDDEAELFGSARVAIAADGSASASALVIDTGRPVAVAAWTSRVDPPSEWSAVRAGALTVERDEDAAQVSFTAEQGGFELSFEPIGRTACFDPTVEPGATGGIATELAACRVSGKVDGGRKRAKLRCPGLLERARAPASPAPTSLSRRIGASFDDGALLGIVARRGPDAEHHGEEAIAARLVEPEESQMLTSGPLLSTQYDEDGRHTRATLEMEVEGEDVPVRAGGSLLCGAPIEAGAQVLRTAFFRWSMGGVPGIGSYKIVRSR